MPIVNSWSPPICMCVLLGRHAGLVISEEPTGRAAVDVDHEMGRGFMDEDFIA